LDHRKYGVNGLISVVSVKYTTAGYVAERVLKFLFPTVKIESLLSQPRLDGGDIDYIELNQNQIETKWRSILGGKEVKRLMFNYGTEAEKVLQLAHNETRSDPSNTNHSFNILKGEALFAIREEMAQKLSDIVFRRTDLGTAGLPPESDIKTISQLMAREMGWTEGRTKAEIEEVWRSYPRVS